MKKEFGFTTISWSVQERRAIYLTFHAYDPGYQVTFALMLTSAIITCTLTTRLKDHAKMSAQAAFRTKILFDTNQLLQKAKSEEEIFSLTASQLMKLLNRSLIVYLEQNGGLGAEQVFGVDGETAQNIFSAPEERDAANWTFANKKRSGKRFHIHSHRISAAIFIFTSS